MGSACRASSTGLSGFGSYHLATADGRCLSQRNLTPNKQYRLGQVVTTANAGLPIAVEGRQGPDHRGRRTGG